MCNFENITKFLSQINKTTPESHSQTPKNHYKMVSFIILVIWVIYLKISNIFLAIWQKFDLKSLK